MKKLSGKIVSSIAVLSLAASCGKESGGGGGGSSARQEQAAEIGLNEGHYQAKFVTLNPHVNGTIPGSANFYRAGDKLYAYVRLFAGGVRAWHQQYIYEGGRCPTLNDDKNLDGFIDIQEAEAVLGKVMIPLDSDISTQSSGRRFFPLADLSGYYHYERITSFNRFLNDLKAEDKEPEDNVRKLAPGEELRIVGRTVMILGVAETVMLPETVATQERRRSFQTLPIVCGVFEKVDKIPGTGYVQDELPGPVADVVEGQDRPAEEPVPETTTGSTSGSTTGTNDSDDGDGPVSDGEGRTTTGSTSGGSTTSGSSTGSTTGGRTTSGSSTGSTTGGRTTSGSTTGESTGGETTSGSTTGETTGETSGPATSSSSTSSSSSSTTTGGASSSSSSTSTGSTAGGSLDSGSGV